MSALTDGNLILAQLWGSPRPLGEYTRTTPSPSSPVQTLIPDVDDVDTLTDPNTNLEPAYVSQRPSGEVVVAASTPGIDIAQVDASNTVSTFYTGAELIAALADLATATGVLNAQVDESDRLILVYWDFLAPAYRVARFNSDHSLDVVEDFGAIDQLAGGYVAISRDGNKLLYVNYGPDDAEFYPNRTVELRTWTIGGAETVIESAVDSSRNPLPIVEVACRASDPAFGFASNGDPLWVPTRQTPPPAAIIFGFPLSGNVLPLGTLHTWTFTDDDSPPINVTDTLPVGSSPFSSFDIPETANYKIEYEIPLATAPFTEEDGVTVGKILRNGTELVSQTFSVAADYDDHMFMQYTGMLDEGDTISATIENVSHVHDIHTVNCFFTISRVQGYQYQARLQRYGASPGSWELGAVYGRDIDIFNGFGDVDPDGGADYYYPYLAADAFGGPQTAWFWRNAASDGKHYLVHVAMPGGSYGEDEFDDPPSGNGAPLWIVGSQIATYPALAVYSKAGVLLTQRTSFS